MLHKVETDNSKCPICGKATYISKDDYACCDVDCPYSVGGKIYINKYSLEEYMQHKIDSYSSNMEQ